MWLVISGGGYLGAGVYMAPDQSQSDAARLTGLDGLHISIWYPLIDLTIHDIPG